LRSFVLITGQLQVASAGRKSMTKAGDMYIWVGWDDGSAYLWTSVLVLTTGQHLYFNRNGRIEFGELPLTAEEVSGEEF